MNVTFLITLIICWEKNIYDYHKSCNFFIADSLDKFDKGQIKILILQNSG